MVRNHNVEADSFRAQTEYVRAMNATKLERVFAKPFLASLDGHTEGVSCMAKHPIRGSIVLSAGRDGQVLFLSTFCRIRVSHQSDISNRCATGSSLEPSDEEL